MEKVASTEILLIPISSLYDAHERGWLNWRGLVKLLRWHIIVEDGPATIFLSDAQHSQHLSVAIRRAEDLADKVNLLVDAATSDAGRLRGHRALHDAVVKGGYDMNRHLWSRLRRGEEQAVPDAALRAIAKAFDVLPEYLLRDDAEVPERAKIKLEEVRVRRRTKVALHGSW